MYEPTNIESKVSKLNVPPTIAEEIVVSLEKAGIIEDERLDVILKDLSTSLQVSKDELGKYKVALNDAHQKVLMKDDVPWTIENWVSDYVFEAGDNDNKNTISYEDSLKLTPEQVKGIAAGTLKVLPAKKEAADKDAIPASELRDRSSRNEMSVEDLASGKQKVDMSK